MSQHTRLRTLRRWQARTLTTTVVTPSPDQPGSYAEQLEILSLFWANPYRRIDRDAAWQLARRLVLAHVRRAAA